MLKHIPNALTLTRLILAPVIAWLMWVGMKPMPDGADSLLYPVRPELLRDYLQLLDEVAMAWALAAILFVVAAITDLFDGMAARAFNAHSKFGRLIDPIADKVIVGLPLILASFMVWRAADEAWLVVALASAVVVIRDISMTVIRLMSPDGEGARVSSLAKIKTTLELVVVGSLLVFVAAGAHMQLDFAREHPDAILVPPYADVFRIVWIALLVITAALSAYTGWQYLKPAKKR